MTFDEIVTHFDGLSNAARALKLPVSTVSEWRRGVPFGRQCQIQIVTGGKLQAQQNGEQPQVPRETA